MEDLGVSEGVQSVSFDRSLEIPKLKSTALDEMIMEIKCIFSKFCVNHLDG